MSKLRKIFTISIMLMTVLSMSVVVAPQAQAAASAGDLIKMDGLSSVYYLAADGKRYVFPNESTYFSWYSDWSGVVTVSQSELEGYPLGKNITVRPGTKLVKITTNPTVYAVEPNGTLRSIVSEANAIALWGANWAKRVIDVPDSFFTNYITGTALTAGVYPVGSLVKTSDSADVYYIGTDGKARKFSNEAAFVSNRLSWNDVITAGESYTLPALGTEISTAEEGVTDTSSGAGGTIGAGSGLSVALSSNTAAAGTIVTGQAIANLASFNLTAASDGDVKITSLKVKRIGVSADATLTSVYLYNGTERLTDSASVSSSFITWNNSAGIITIPAGTTKTVTVKSNIAASTSGQLVGISINAASDIITNGAAITGSFPASGNLMSIADATLAGVSFDNSGTPTANTALDPQDEFVLWTNVVTIGTRAVNMEYITFRQIGSVLSDDLRNFKLLIDGVQKGDTIARLDSNGYVTFDFSSSPLKLETGARTFKVLVDIVGGSSRTTSLSLRQAADASFIDTEYNANVLVQADDTTFTACTSGTQTISSGNLTITKKTDSVSGNIVNGATGITFATYEFKATGEAVKVESLYLNAVVSDSNIDELRNGKIFANGVQVGSTADIAASDGTAAFRTLYSLGSSLIVNPGTPVTVEVRADVYEGTTAADTTNSVNAADTIAVQIASSSSNAQRLTSLSYFSTPSTDKTGNTLTVKEGGLTLSKYTGYNNHSAVDPQNAYKIAEYRLTADTTESVNITAFNLDFDNSTLDVEVADDLADVYIVYGNKTSVTKSTVASTTNSWTVSETIAAGSTMTISVYADVLSSIGASAVLKPQLTVSGTSVGSAASADSSEVYGQSTTWTTGEFTTAATENPLDQMVFGGQTVIAGTYNLTSRYDTYTVEEVAVKFLDANVVPAVAAVELWDGSTCLNPGGTTVSATYIATTTGLSLVVPANTQKILTVKLQLNPVSIDSGVVPGLNASTTLDTIMVRNSAGTQSSVGTDLQANNVIVFKSYPVFTSVPLSTTIRNDVSQNVFAFKVAPSSNGSIMLKQFVLDLTWNNQGAIVNKADGYDIELDNIKLYRGSTDISTLVTTVSEDNGGLNLEGSSGATTTTGRIIFAWATEEQVSSETTYYVKATPRNFEAGTTSSDSVVLTFDADTAYGKVAGQYIGDQDGDNEWGLSTTATANQTAEYKLLWSDYSAGDHAYTSGSSSADWANGYQIKNLPLDSQSLSI
ncbi:MAG: hypothetical protein WC323_03635 [Patescibacteria group bacterium]|jgi:hypothetical protein